MKFLDTLLAHIETYKKNCPDKTVYLDPIIQGLNLRIRNKTVNQVKNEKDDMGIWESIIFCYKDGLEFFLKQKSDELLKQLLTICDAAYIETFFKKDGINTTVEFSNINETFFNELHQLNHLLDLEDDWIELQENSDDETHSDPWEFNTPSPKKLSKSLSFFANQKGQKDPNKEIKLLLENNMKQKISFLGLKNILENYKPYCNKIWLGNFTTPAQKKSSLEP